ncbi:MULTISPECIES: acyl-CoA-binding protein [Tenacibaculum]|uniref:acyl-CoA-binding protein n=1 Tax=Tenacibaculum TaxID=104267 RepID=UPI00089C3E2A|nr:MULTISPECIES: acyl-CoA-binding protein [unclassified Tenacibaculum]RBW61347.1 phosphatidylserine decarboxylase [Tenacibaculum sp. E3R01]SEE36698.1 Acyl-CoA-binding protein [Tenacibaculum sp. MAR_2010_89]
MINDLDIQFQEAYKIASNMQGKLPQDIMLKLYAYYKQAMKGDQFSFNANNNTTTGLRSAFKFNAWVQLKGMSPEDAKKEYINLVNTIIKQYL